MSNQSPVRIVLANRPRLFRELLQHTLDGMTEQKVRQFQVTAVTDSMPTATQLQDADWLIVDEETAASAIKAGTANPGLKILSVEGRGNRLQYLVESSPVRWQLLSASPTLDELVGILTETSPKLQPATQA